MTTPPAGDTDAIVIGSGINSLVAAAELAGAGWSVRLLERNSRIGGFILSEERTVPGYVHDTYSSWHPLFVSGGAYASLGGDLARHGLTYCNTDDAVSATVGANGRAVIAYRDPARTAEAFEHADDRRAYLGSLDAFGADAPQIGAFMSNGIRTTVAARAAATLVRRNRRAGSERLLRDAVTSGRAWCRNEFDGDEVDRLWIPWLLHAGLSPDHASGGLMIPIFAATMHGFGLPIVQGGASGLVDAFTSLLLERGVHIHTDSMVSSIDVEGGRAAGVTVADGTRYRARRAVVASVTPTALYGELLPPSASSSAVRKQASKFRYGRGEMQIHLALSTPPAWTDTRLSEVPLIHVSDGSSSTSIACAQAEAGLLPARPTVVVGQQYVLDPTRVPAGGASLWLQLQEVPYEPVGDSADRLETTGGWTDDLAHAYAQRVIDRVAEHAPGLSDSIIGIDVITPVDLERFNPNARRGDPYSGSAELDQSYLWRPLSGVGRHRTDIDGLWHIGASTHPGPGLGGGSGSIVARELTTPSVLSALESRLRRR